MKIKEVLDIIEHKELYVYTIEYKQYKTLAMPSVSGDFNKYHEECEKLRELAKANEYTVKEIGMIKGNSNSRSFIFIECEKEAE